MKLHYYQFYDTMVLNALRSLRNQEVTEISEDVLDKYGTF